MGMVQFLTFFIDDNTTIDGATVPLGTDPTEAQTSCGTNVSHTRPAMMFHDAGIDRGFNIAECSVSIGAASFRIQDNRRTGDQGTGWFSYMMADAGGVPALTGQRVVFQQKDDYSGAIYTVANLLVQDITFDDSSKTVYEISTRDFRERERSMRLFDVASNSVIWPYGDKVLNGVSGAGSRTGYGRLVPNAFSPRLIPASKGVKATWIHNIIDPNAHIGNFVLEVQPWIDGGRQLGFGTTSSVPSLNPFTTLKAAGNQLKPNGSMWYDYFVAYNLLSTADTSTPLTTPTAYGSYATPRKLTGMSVEWRVWGTFGAWIPLTAIYDWRLFSSTGAEIPSPLGFTAFTTDINNGAVRYKLGGIAFGALTSGELPTNGVAYEIRIISGLPPRGESPMYIEEGFGTFLKKVYDGAYSSNNLPIKYNAARMIELEASTPLLRTIVTSSKDSGQDWLVDNWYKPMGMFPYVNPNGEIEPRSIDLPDASVTVDVIDDSMVLSSSAWSLVTNDAVTQVDFTYLRDYVTTERDFASVEVHVDKINAPAMLAVGDKVVSMSPETVHDVSGNIAASYGQGPASYELGYRLALKAQHRLLDRLAYGGQHCTIDAHRSFSVVRSKSIGDWIIASISWLPDLQTRRRGMYRLMQIANINESDSTFRRFECIDAGPSGQPLAVPTGVTASFAGANILTVAVGGLPAGADFAVYAAESTAQPAASDGLWTLLTRKTGSGTFVSPSLPNTSLWVKVRSEQLGYRPSVFTTATNLTLNASAGVIAPQLTIDGDGNAIFTWSPAPGVNSLRLRFQVVAEGATPTSPLPILVTLDPNTVTSYSAGVVPPGFVAYSSVESSTGAGFTGVLSVPLALRAIIAPTLAVSPELTILSRVDNPTTAVFNWVRNSATYAVWVYDSLIAIGATDPYYAGTVSPTILLAGTDTYTASVPAQGYERRLHFIPVTSNTSPGTVIDYDVYAPNTMAPVAQLRTVFNANRDAVDVYAALTSPASETVAVSMRDSEAPGAPVYTMCVASGNPATLYVASGTEIGPTNWFTNSGSFFQKLSAISLKRDQITRLSFVMTGFPSGALSSAHLALSNKEQPWLESVSATFDNLTGNLTGTAKGGANCASCSIEMSADNFATVPYAVTRSLADGGMATLVQAITGTERGKVWSVRFTPYNAAALGGLAGVAQQDECLVVSALGSYTVTPSESGSDGTLSVVVVDASGALDATLRVSWAITSLGVRTLYAVNGSGAGITTSGPTSGATSGTYTITFPLLLDHATKVEPLFHMADGTTFQPGGELFDLDRVADVWNVDVTPTGVVTATFDTDTASGVGGAQYSLNAGTTWVNMTVTARVATVTIAPTAAAQSILIRGVNGAGSPGPSVTAKIPAIIAANNVASIQLVRAYDVVYPGDGGGSFKAGWVASNMPAGTTFDYNWTITAYLTAGGTASGSVTGGASGDTVSVALGDGNTAHIPELNLVVKAMFAGVQIAIGAYAGPMELP